jgi:hypothetical protein
LNADTPMSSHGNRSMPPTAAATSPKPITRSARMVRVGGLSSASIASNAAARSISPAISASAMRSVSASRYRSLSPGGSRTTRVVSLAPGRCCGSLKVRISAVGLDQGSHSSRRRSATSSSAASSRCAVVPYRCRRSASSTMKRMRSA